MTIFDTLKKEEKSRIIKKRPRRDG